MGVSSRRGTVRRDRARQCWFLAVLAAGGHRSCRSSTWLCRRRPPLHLSTSYVHALIGKYLCYAMLALAVDLIWGYCGILSLGHAAFFALGGYAMGMYLMRADRPARRLRRPGPARLHGVPELEEAARGSGTASTISGSRCSMMVLVPAAAGARVRLARVPVARHRRVPVDHHAGAQLRADARVLPQRHGLRRQQRLHRFQGHRSASICTPTARASCCWWRSRPSRSRASYLACRAIVASRAGRVIRAIRDAESRTRFLGYPRRVLQALGVRLLRRPRRHRRRALRAAGRHHQPERVRADQLDRGRHLGGGRRARHAVRRRGRRRARQLREDVSSPARCPKSGCTRSARSSCSSRSSCRAGSSAWCRPGTKRNSN